MYLAHPKTKFEGRLELDMLDLFGEMLNISDLRLFLKDFK